MVRRLVIGDIHGCLDELNDLLDAAGVASDDEIIAVGDIVDRGPESPAVLDFFRTTPSATSVMGNHERKHVRSYHGLLEPALSQQITRRQIGERSYGETCRFMAELPHFIDLPEALILHGFWEPGVALADQREKVVVGVLSGEYYLMKKYKRPWYDLYDGDKPLIVGHHDYSRAGKPLVRHDRLYGIDTGCVYGRKLTGLLLPEFKLISVPSRRDYWSQLRQQFAQFPLHSGDFQPQAPESNKGCRIEVQGQEPEI